MQNAAIIAYLHARQKGGQCCTMRFLKLTWLAVIYHHLALNVPLYCLFTYVHDAVLVPGTRVCVPFRNKLVVGVVWAAAVTPDIDVAKIQPIQQVFDAEPRLPESWLALLDFTARYYHYPLGQAALAALPQGLRQTRAVRLPEPVRHYTLSILGRQHAPPPIRHAKQVALWQVLSKGTADMAALKAIYVQAAKYIQIWQDAGWITVQTEAAYRASPIDGHVLNPEQQAASQAVQAALPEFVPFLLYGITGSGKTEVYFDIMDKVLAQGRQVLFLLPEINLTPQLLKRLSQRFAQTTTAVLHSQMAAGARTQNYLRAALGQAALVVGTRLAVFTPMPHLGLIVVDEEHDASFKQDSELRYQARDLAVWRARQAKCPIVLGSATPSLESWHKARMGDYTLLTLTQRAHAAAQLPQVHLVDTRRLPLDQGFTEVVKEKLQANYASGGMSMVYLNRRGFAPALFCSACGHVFGCPHCAAKMVLHQRAHQLRCHHCDYRMPVPSVCPECGNQDLTAVGQGTQRLEETLRHWLPGARVARVDRDSTSHKQDWAQLYEHIARNEIDVLVGTQMLAKGHDFARLNLVVVVNADGSLFSADFRASERLFAELMQVAGRAGRADLPGEVWVQTQQPENKVYQALKAQDYTRFADAELAERRDMAMPPFAHMAAVRADARTMQAAQQLLRTVMAASVQQHGLPEHVNQFGPVPMLMARLAGYERAQVFLESRSRRDLHRAVSWWQTALLAEAKSHPHIRWLIDVDPMEL